jgi:hypothetical protein
VNFNHRQGDFSGFFSAFASYGLIRIFTLHFALEPVLKMSLRRFGNRFVFKIFIVYSSKVSVFFISFIISSNNILSSVFFFTISLSVFSRNYIIANSIQPTYNMLRDQNLCKTKVLSRKRKQNCRSDCDR